MSGNSSVRSLGQKSFHFALRCFGVGHFKPGSGYVQRMLLLGRFEGLIDLFDIGQNFGNA
jgi:hypothetical protein